MPAALLNVLLSDFQREFVEFIDETKGPLVISKFFYFIDFVR